MNTRRITLTDRPPVIIEESDWREIAVARGPSPDPNATVERVQASIRVREHRDGRRLVYGVADDADGMLYAAGYLLPLDDARDERTVDAIRKVSAKIGRPTLAPPCIADLPAEKL